MDRRFPDTERLPAPRYSAGWRALSWRFVGPRQARVFELPVPSPHQSTVVPAQLEPVAPCARRRPRSDARCPSDARQMAVRWMPEMPPPDLPPRIVVCGRRLGRMRELLDAGASAPPAPPWRQRVKPLARWPALLRRTAAESALVFNTVESPRHRALHVGGRLGGVDPAWHGLDRQARSARGRRIQSRCPIAFSSPPMPCGRGLNLHQRCRLVINLELPWNPVRLEQRIGSGLISIGQTRRVAPPALRGPSCTGETGNPRPPAQPDGNGARGNVLEPTWIPAASMVGAPIGDPGARAEAGID